MVALLWILATLFTLLLALLFTPLRIEVDTEAERYRVSLGWVGALALLSHDWPWRYRARIFFVSWERPLEMASDARERTAPETLDHRPKGSGSLGWTMSRKRQRWLLRAAWHALKAGRIRRFHWYMSTDDPVIDAWLYPLVHLWRIRGADVRVRFDGHNELALTMEHSAARVLWAIVLTR